MEKAFPILAVVAVCAILVLVAVASHRARKRRREALAVLATELGWTFDPSSDKDHDDHYAHFELFRRGHSREAYNTLTGDAEIAAARAPVKMGDFLYKVTTSNGKTTTTTTHRFSYAIVHLPFVATPDLLIRREGVFDKIAGAFGFDDIDFESAEFSRAFHVKSPDKRFAYDVIHPRMMEFLLAKRGPAVDIERARCCLTDGRSVWAPEQFRAMLAWAAEFFALWPEHVRESLTARAAAENAGDTRP